MSLALEVCRIAETHLPPDPVRGLSLGVEMGRDGGIEPANFDGEQPPSATSSATDAARSTSRSGFDHDRLTSIMSRPTPAGRYS